jgi:sugar O-acyltransferase (sialic acid O-acetyltransferase NeuD family)
MKKFILWGAGGFSLVVDEGLHRQGHRVVAIFDNDPKKKSPLPNVPIIGGVDSLKGWVKNYGTEELIYGLVTIGGSHGEARITLQSQLKDAGVEISPFIHDASFVATTAEIGAGSQIYALACVSAAVKIAEAVIINHAAYIGHECVISNGVHVGPGAKLNGEVVVHKRAFIGTGAVILPRLSIGEDAVVGAGSIVTKSVASGAVVVGNPAREISELNKTGLRT